MLDSRFFEVYKQGLEPCLESSSCQLFGESNLQACCGLFSIRMWNLEQSDNYVLSVDGSGFESGEVVNCISYNKVKGISKHLFTSAP